MPALYPSLQLLEPVTSLEISKRPSIILLKTCCLDYIPTAVIKQCSSVFSELIAYLANLSFSQGSFPSQFKHASVTLLLKKPSLDPTVCGNFRLTYNLNSMSKILERLFHTRLQPYIASSPSFNQLIANITLLKPFSITSLILSAMQLIMGLPLFISLSTSMLHSTQLTTPFYSIISLPVLESWISLTFGLSLISSTGLFQSLPAPLPLSYYLHLVVFPKALS